eukprot:gene236-4482_t
MISRKFIARNSTFGINQAPYVHQRSDGSYVITFMKYPGLTLEFDFPDENSMIIQSIQYPVSHTLVQEILTISGTIESEINLECFSKPIVSRSAIHFDFDVDFEKIEFVESSNCYCIIIKERLPILTEKSAWTWVWKVSDPTESSK